MAKFYQNGPFVGPGEERTAQYLEKKLPDNWVVISGVQIASGNREDIDFLVVAENRIFVIEEKFWGPTVVLGEPYWQVGTDSRKSPVYGISHKAKVLQSFLKEAFPFAKAISQRPTVAAIVLSHPNLNLKGIRQSEDFVLRLEETADSLIDKDKERDSDLFEIRDQVIEKLSGLPSKPTEIKRIGDYIVIGSGRQFGNLTKFRAEHYITGATTQLTCFHRDIGKDSSPEFNRELISLKKVQNLQRTWPSSEPFEYEPLNWMVLASFMPVGAENLNNVATQSKQGELPSLPPDSLSTTDDLSIISSDQAASIMMDAFSGLSDIHNIGIIHRSLSPSRIWLGKGRRVLFSDFTAARIETQATLHHSTLDTVDDRELFMAPEVQEDLHQASTASDVFSLALICAHWLHFFSADTSLAEIRAKLMEDGTVGQALIPALHEKPKMRPNATNILEKLKEAVELSENDSEEILNVTAAQPKISNDFVEGNKVGKYTLVRLLGSSHNVSNTWLATDSVENEKPVIIKQFLTLDKFESSKTSISVLNLINHERTQSLISTFDEPNPGYSVSQYIEGDTLNSRKEIREFSIQQIKSVASEAFRLVHDAFHSKNIIHGDISPNNLLLDPDDAVYFIDLELATLIGAPLRGFTRTYAAPEALHNGALATVEMDIYSLAASIISVMLGRPPYATRAPGQESDNKIVAPTENEIAQWGPDGEALLKVLFKCVDPEPHRRPTDALELSRKIARARGLSPEQQPEVGTVDLINKNVDELRQLFVDSQLGNSGMLALGSHFAKDTYIPTRLDTELLPQIIDGKYRHVIFTGNPGDGKTSFLQTVGNALHEASGSYIHEDNGGWRILLGDKSFAAIYDASESFENLTSDERINAALIAPKGTTTHTLLIAMNDGRLAQFVETNSDTIEDLEVAYENYAVNGDAEFNGTLIVDMKQRSLVDGDGGGLAKEITDSLTDELLWEGANCADCASSGQCPIFRNVLRLRNNGKPALTELVTMSHLAAGRRATVRDFRSALAWIVTGDLGCKDVHEGRAKEEDLSSDPQFQIWNLAYSKITNDKLINEWYGFDPSKSVPSRIMRTLSSSPEVDFTTLPSDELVTQISRQAFWGEFHSENISPRELNIYVHFSEILNYLATGQGGKRLLERLLLGMSRMVGAHGFTEHALAISEPSLIPEWSVIKILDLDNFALDSPLSGQGHNLLESLRDKVTLRYVPNGLTFVISLDTAEIILRSAEGEIFGDAQSDAIRRSISSFANKLLSENKKHALLVNPIGAIKEVTLNGDLIELETK